MVNIDWSKANRHKRGDGHIQLRKTVDGKHYYKDEHVYVWELYNGEKPKGYNIHHIDENPSNNDISNLELLSFSGHKRRHSGHILKDGAWWKPCGMCGVLKEEQKDFYLTTAKGQSKYFSICKQCDRERSTEYRNNMIANDLELFVARRKNNNGKYYSKNKDNPNYLARKKATQIRYLEKKKRLLNSGE